MSTIDSWYIPDRALILPSSRQRTSYLNEILEDIAGGFTKMDRATTVSSGASTTIGADDYRLIVITGNSLTHTVTLPAGSATKPPVKIVNLGTGNVITLAGAGSDKIMSGSTAGQITLRTLGDFVELVWINSTIGWAIIRIKSRRFESASGNTTYQLNRFQDFFVENNNFNIALTVPTDSQHGDSISISARFSSSLATFAVDSVDVMPQVIVGGFVTFSIWRGASAWVLPTYSP